jgi:hypothetical protein
MIRRSGFLAVLGLPLLGFSLAGCAITPCEGDACQETGEAKQADTAVIVMNASIDAVPGSRSVDLKLRPSSAGSGALTEVDFTVRVPEVNRGFVSGLQLAAGFQSFSCTEGRPYALGDGFLYKDYSCQYASAPSQAWDSVDYPFARFSVRPTGTGTVNVELVSCDVYFKGYLSSSIDRAFAIGVPLMVSGQTVSSGTGAISMSWATALPDSRYWAIDTAVDDGKFHWSQIQTVPDNWRSTSFNIACGKSYLVRLRQPDPETGDDYSDTSPSVFVSCSTTYSGGGGGRFKVSEYYWP